MPHANAGSVGARTGVTGGVGGVGVGVGGPSGGMVGGSAAGAVGGSTDGSGSTGGSDLRNAAVFVSASGGVGVSVFAALCARTIVRGGTSCALADMDLPAGGMDVVLGLESEPGLRWGGINAPLGRIEPSSLRNELPKWDGMPVLAADSWSASLPDWWEVHAAVRALSQISDVLVLDAGHAQRWRELRPAVVVLVVELSVLGLARARAELLRLVEGDVGGTAGMVGGVPGTVGGGVGVNLAGGMADGAIVVVGAPPPWSSKMGTVDIGEAEDYLGREMVGMLARDAALGRSVLAGTGVTTVPRRLRTTVDVVCERIERECRPLKRRTVGGNEGVNDGVAASGGRSPFGGLRGRR
ncbi:cobyric acid synthase [Bifidobacterium margollesii]|uniref:Cobyric acid synthase n=2 Tax=Bifidobacterium margollesii TaxID=2020964 RepID=A0A2N5JC51_9BIFI|nr:cobyric acid synthase [Bifidobacterium margollesii]